MPTHNAFERVTIGQYLNESLVLKRINGKIPYFNGTINLFMYYKKEAIHLWIASFYSVFNERLIFSYCLAKL
jgi:hypothetical protein